MTEARGRGGLRLGLVLAALALACLPGRAAAAPLAWSPAFALDTTGGRVNLAAVACPSSAQCTAVDVYGQALTFDPRAPGAPTPAVIDAGQSLVAVACPATTQCTALDDSGRELTFDPAAPGVPTPVPVTFGSHSLACPSVSQCTAVDSTGEEVTFDPAAPGSPAPVGIAPNVFLTRVACPSPTQCTAVDDVGEALTFDPGAPGTPMPTTVDPQTVLTGLACPAPTRCTAVDAAGGQVSFDPTAPGTPTPTTVDPSRILASVACPSVTRCTAVELEGGGAVTFDPTAPGSPVPVTVDPGQAGVDRVGHGFAAAAPAGVPENLAPPAVSGTALEGQVLSVTPGTWSNGPTAFAYQWLDCDVTGLTCLPAAGPGATSLSYTLTATDAGSTIRVEETASNAAGPGLPVKSAPTAVVAPLPPASTAPPNISGTPVAGQTLTEAHGGWTGSPTGYALQWEDCDGAGNACAPIAGATGQTYALSAGDVGHTIRVVEVAANAGGSSVPVASAPTAAVSAPAPPAAKPVNTTSPAITGSSHVGGKLACSTGVWTGTPPIAYAYQWLADGTPLTGAMANTYTAKATDVATAVTCAVTASNAGGSATEESRASIVTAAPACFGLAGASLGRCRARAAYDLARAKCGAISTRTRAGRVRRAACTAKAKLTYKRALALVKCQSVKGSKARAACVARAHRIKK